MPFTWFVAMRYLRAAKGQTALILAAVAVGVAVVVFLSAIIEGLQVSLVDKTLGAQAHVTLEVPERTPRALVEATERAVAKQSEPGGAASAAERRGNPPDSLPFSAADASREWAIARRVQGATQRIASIDRWPAVVADLEQVAGVTAVSPRIVGAGVALSAQTQAPIVIQGIEAQRFLAIVDLKSKLIAGRFDVVGGVALGSTLAATLGVEVGDRLHLATSEGTEDQVTVTGVFTLGNAGADKAWLITSLRHAQSLFRLPGGATAIEIKITDVFDAEQVARALQDRTGLDAESWMALNRELLAGLSAQSGSKWIIQFFVIVAVALGIASVLAVSVVQKSREIGILRAVGTPAHRVLQVFLIQGGVLGFAGALLGCGLGAALARLFAGVALGPDGAPRFPVVLDLALFMGAIALATGVGLLSAVLPARRAARIDPAQAIRNG